MNRIFVFILFSFLLGACSLNENSKLWNEKDKSINENKNKKKVLVEKKKTN